MSSRADQDIVISGFIQNLYENDYVWSAVIEKNGCQYIEGGAAYYTIINNGGEQLVHEGGQAAYTTINAGGMQGAWGSGVSWTTINSGGLQAIQMGGFVDITTIDGGRQNINISASALGTTVNSGGIQYISIGGAATSTTINASGSQIANGTAIEAIVNDGGTQIVDQDGVAIRTTVSSGGSQYIGAGGSAQSAWINNGTQDVDAGGQALNTTLDSGGIQYAWGSGVVSTTINSGGIQAIQSNSLVTGTIIMDGGRQNVNMAASAIHTTVNSGGLQYISIKGTATNTIVNASGRMEINGTANNAVINSGGLQQLGDSGKAIKTIVEAGATQAIDYNGIAQDTSLNGFQVVDEGGQAVNTLINNGGEQAAFGSGVVSTTINSGGLQNIQSNGLVTSTIINNGGRQNVNFDTSANITIVNSGGLQFVNGIASNTILNSGGSQVVGYKGKAYSITVNYGAVQQVYNDTTVFDVSLAGTQYLNATGASATGVKIWKTGRQFISGGATDSGAIVNGGQILDNGGCARSAAINYGGFQTVSSGGIYYDTGLSGIQHLYAHAHGSGTKIYLKGEQRVYSGAKAKNAIATGKQTVYAGGSALNGVFNRGAIQNIYGWASGNIIAGTQNIFKGGIASADRITGLQSIAAGARAVGTILSKGGRQQVNGSAANASVAGTQLIGNGGTVTGAKVWATGNQTVLAGGTETGTIVNGVQVVNAGGKSFNAAINQVATQRIYGAAKNTGLSGKQYVYAGAAVMQAKIYLKGVQYIQSGATVTGAKATGRQIVNAGGSAVSGVFNKGARQDVYGVATGTVVAGIQNIYSGGTAQNGSLTATGKINVMAGGRLTITSNMTAAGQINLAGATVTGTAGRQLALSTTSYLAMGAGNKISNIGVNAAGRVLINGANNSMQSLTTGATTTTTFDLRNLSASSTPILKVAAKTTLNGTAAVQVKTGQSMGVYTLGANLSRSASVGLNVDGKGITKIGVGRAYAYNGVNYLVANSGQNLTLTLSLARGAIYTAANSQARSASALTGTSLSDIFIAGQGNDVISGNGGRDVAVYGADKWGKDTIEKTNGTMTLLFRDLKSSDVRQTMDGKDMILQKAGNSGDEIRVKDWNSATHNVVFGGTMGELSRYAAAASPTSAQANAASNEVWKKSGLLA